MRFKIINPLRFQRAVITILVTICLLFCAALFSNYGEPEEYKVYLVTVAEGDTVWTISDRYNGENVDIRYVIYILQKINGIEGGDIHPGEEIYVPVFTD